MKWDAKQYLSLRRNARSQPATLRPESRWKRSAAKRWISAADRATARDGKATIPGSGCAGDRSIPGDDPAAREENPTLSFQVFDVTRDFTALGTDYDLVFSNACLQWVPGHEQLLPRLIGLLRPGGILAVQLPNNFEEPVHRIAERVAAKQNAIVLPGAACFLSAHAGAVF
mgnify:CR=1 FL=1